jgi:hypothetical protein
MDVDLEIKIVRWLLKAVAVLSLLALMAAFLRFPPARHDATAPGAGEGSASEAVIVFTVSLAGLAASYGFDSLRPGPPR